MTEEIEKKIKNSLWGFVVGDFYGVPYEFQSANSIKSVEYTGYGTHYQPPGTWSDDTSLMLATMESFNKVVELNLNDIQSIYRSFLNESMNEMTLWLEKGKYAYKSNVFDVGRTTSKALKTGSPGKKFEDNGNGSLMRMTPIAILQSYFNEPFDLCEISFDFSCLTHAHLISVDGCYRYLRTYGELLKGLDCKFKYESNFDPHGYVLGTLNIALQSLKQSSFIDGIKWAISLGGDTDTNAAVAGSLLGLKYDVPEELRRQCIDYDYIEGEINKFIHSINKIKELN